MIFVADEQIEQLLTPAATQAALREAFVTFADGRAAIQPRIKTEAAGVRLSTMGAVIPSTIPGTGVAGAKIYTTIAGKFSFVIVLFSSESGQPLAVMESNTITRLRTAACTVITAQAAIDAARVRTIVVFGAGVQGQSHLEQLAAAYPQASLRVVNHRPVQAVLDDLSTRTGLEVRQYDAERALDGADLVVMATRSKTPLVDDALLPRDGFVALVGSSLPTSVEASRETVRRAGTVIVEWAPQTLKEAGDLVQLGDDAATLPLLELSDLLSGRKTVAPGGLVLYKSVGIGLEDVAVAGAAWQRLQSRTR
ncbi:ornithine cyclodeaminase family protein [soil metagenome]